MFSDFNEEVLRYSPTRRQKMHTFPPSTNNGSRLDESLLDG